MPQDELTATIDGQNFRLTPRVESKVATIGNEQFNLIPRQKPITAQISGGAQADLQPKKSPFGIPQYPSAPSVQNIQQIGDVVSRGFRGSMPGQMLRRGKAVAKVAEIEAQPQIEKAAGKLGIPGATGTYSIGGGQVTTGTQDFGRSVKEYANQTIAPPLEAAKALATGAMAFPVSLGVTFMQAVGGATSLEDALRIGEEFSHKFIQFMPKTERGQKLTEAAFKPFEYAFQKPEDFLVKQFGGGNTETEAKIKLAWRSAILAAPVVYAKGKGIKFDFTKPFNEAFREVARDMGTPVTRDSAMKYFHSGLDPRKQIMDLIDPTGEIGSEGRGIINEFRSPSQVLGRDKSGGKIYDNFERATLEELSFLQKQGEKYKAATQGIQRDSALETGVFKTADNRIPIDTITKLSEEVATKYDITPQELKAIKAQPTEALRFRKFISDEFPALLRRYGDSIVDSTTEKKIWNATQGGKKIKRIKDVETGKMRKLNDTEAILSDLYSRRIKDYVPHMFDKSTLLEYLDKQIKTNMHEKSRVRPDSKEFNSLFREGERLQATYDNISKSPNQDLLLFDQLPSKLRFDFFNPRKGQQGYNVSAMRAYETYVSGIARKIFIEPAVKEAALDFQTLNPELKSYASRYIRDFAGYSRGSKGASRLRSLQWMLKLGANPRSAVTNWTQKLNTFADQGIAASVRGYKNAVTNKGNIRQVFEATGLPETVHQVFLGEGTGGIKQRGLEASRRAVGYMFSKVEYGNRLHAFSSAYFKSKKQFPGRPESAHIQAGVKSVKRNQFFYGKLDQPMIMRTTRGMGESPVSSYHALATQFWSYPVKQMELLGHWWKKDKKALLKWVALAEGGRLALDELLGIDMSSAMGVGDLNYGDFFEALDAVAEGDWTRANLERKKAYSGGGILPYGAGPAVDLVGDMIDFIAGESNITEVAKKQFLPVVAQRGEQSLRALAEGEVESGKYPIRKATGDLLYKETPLQIGARVFIARPSIEKRGQKVVSDSKMEQQLRTKLMRTISDAFASGDDNKAQAMMERYNIEFSPQSFDAAIKRRNLTSADRAMINKSMKQLAWEEMYLK